MKKDKKKENQPQAAVLQLESNPFEAFTVSTMMVIMKKPLFGEGEASSSPASPGSGW